MMQKVSATLNLRKYSPFFFLPPAGVYGKSIKQGMQCRKSEGGSTGMEAENAAKNPRIQMQYGNQFCVQRKANTAENSHWSGTSAASLITNSATPRVFRRICLGAEHKTDFRKCKK